MGGSEDPCSVVASARFRGVVNRIVIPEMEEEMGIGILKIKMISIGRLFFISHRIWNRRMVLFWNRGRVGGGYKYLDRGMFGNEIDEADLLHSDIFLSFCNMAKQEYRFAV